MLKLKHKNAISFSRRIIMFWVFGIAVPFLIVESLILWQFYRINHNEVDEGIKGALSIVSENMNDLMNSMNSISWLLEADGTVGKNLYLYFDEENSVKKGDLLIYIQGQIANYEVANPSIANLTYLYVPEGRGTAIKINHSSLANGNLPENEYFLCEWQNMTFYGPHPANSKAGVYPCISLLRPYKKGPEYGNVYIYLESGYKYLEKLIPSGIMGMDTVLLIESEKGVTLYSSDESLVPTLSVTDDYVRRLTVDTHRYRDYVQAQEGKWRIHLWVPENEYYKKIYGMALNFGIVTILVVLGCIIASSLQWKSIYQPFTKFERQLHQIAADRDVETQVKQMNIQEFDDNFALLEKMKKNILLLLNKAQVEEKRRSELEIKAVLGKINPHFLYNTLDTLKWYAAGKSDKEMVHFITALNGLLLYNMSKTRETTLKSELDAVSAYIVLQQLKYDIDFHIDTGKHPEILQTGMPRFVLQPLVENAILHSGLINEKIWIEVELLANGKIAILIKNTGTAINPEKIKEVLIQKNDISSNGIGLQYVARLLESRFGEEFEMKAERTVDEINIVEIRIPFEAEEVARDLENYSRGGAAGS